MHQLLIATDFSAAARNAFEYALSLAGDLQAELHLVFINKPVSARTTLSEGHLRALSNREKSEYKRRLKRWAMTYPDQQKLPVKESSIHYHVYEGKVASSLVQAALALEADAILLGGREKHNIRAHLFGSVTTHLIGRSPCPILVIPEKARFQPLQSIALAIDVTLKEGPVLERLNTVASYFGAAVLPFFVNMLPEEQDKIKVEQLDANGQRIDMVRDNEVASGIAYYLEQEPAQMLAMYIPKRAFHEHLLHGHLLRYMAWHTPLPLLLLRE